MPKFLDGDKVKYIGGNLEPQEGIVDGVKVMISEETGRPIYYIIWDGTVERYNYGIHEKYLKLVKRKEPDWRI